jgi:16S rRNA C1402 N4-methylase RsmH
MLRHQPVLASETFAQLPSHLERFFDGTFGHGGHTEYLFTHRTSSPLPHVIACDIDETILHKGLEFTQSRTANITPILDTYAHIHQI